MQVLSDLDSITVESLREAGHYKWTQPGSDLLCASAAEMDYGTAPSVFEELSQAIQRGTLGYLPPAVADELSSACADWQARRYGWPVSPKDVRLLPDVIRAFHVAISWFSRPGSAVIVPVPAHVPFLSIPGLLGRQVIQVGLIRSAGRYVYDLDALDAAYVRGGNLLVLCNPHNPVGRVMELEELTAITNIVARHGGRVFADEVYAPVVYGRRHVPYASTSDVAAGHTLTATSASKAWNLAGLKCAQVILGSEDDRVRWEQIGRLDTDGTAVLGAVAGIAAYRHGEPWLDTVISYLDSNRRLLRELLHDQIPLVDYDLPEGTFLAWLDFSKLRIPYDDIAGFLAAKAKVAVVNGADCGLGGRRSVRLNFATSATILERIVLQIEAAVASYC